MLKPQKDWGGKGLIGCEFAGGFLNQLPLVKDTNISENNIDAGSYHFSADSIAVTKAIDAVAV